MPLFNLKHTIATQRFSCRFDAVHGTYSLYDVLKNQFVIENAAFGIKPPGPPTSPVMFAGEHFVLDDEASSGDASAAKLTYKHAKYPIGLVLEAATDEDDDSSMTVRVGFTNRSSKPMGLRAIYPLWVDPRRDGAIDLGGVWSRGAMLRNGAMSATDCNIEHFSKPDGTEYGSSSFTLLHHLISKRNLCVGFLTLRDQLSNIIASPDTDGMHITAACETDESHVGPGATLWSETLWMRVTDDPNAQLARYAELSATATNGSAITVKPAASGWSSLGCSGGAVTQADVEANVLWLLRNKRRVSASYVVIDEGWQTNVGDWAKVDASRFAEGLAPVVAKIRAAGLEAGLWIAPFLARANSVVFEDHPEWFLRDNTNRPQHAIDRWGGACYALDCTNPDALEWMRGVVTTVVKVWGFTRLKLDGLAYAAMEGSHRADPHATRAQAYRAGIEAIRSAAGPDVYLQGLGALLGPSVGILDAVRVEPEAAGQWEVIGTGNGIRLAGRNSLIRSFLNEHWFRCDHDVVSSADPAALGDDALEERIMRETLLALAGGGAEIVGDLPSATDSSIAALRQVCASHPIAAQAWDPLSHHDAPSRFVVTDGDTKLVGLFNWTDSADPGTFDLGELGVNRNLQYLIYDARQGKLLTTHAHREWAGGPIPHHTVRLLVVAPAPNGSKPVLLGSSFNATQGLGEVKCEWTRTALSITMSVPAWIGDGGALTFFAPEVGSASIGSVVGASDVSVSVENIEGGKLMTLSIGKVTGPETSVTIDVEIE